MPRPCKLPHPYTPTYLATLTSKGDGDFSMATARKLLMGQKVSSVYEKAIRKAMAELSAPSPEKKEPPTSQGRRLTVVLPDGSVAS